jgi:hypothetical protein
MHKVLKIGPMAAACAALAGCVMLQGGATYMRTVPVGYDALAACVYATHPWQGVPPSFEPGGDGRAAVIEQTVAGITASTRLVFTPVATGGAKVVIDAVMRASQIKALFLPTIQACAANLPAAAQTPAP